ncbi:hypothetical protein BJ170DRAFT_92455 [Xylariales sp. AK1849]|nr:hypothetical protein BJ170DRAFT_92455 [Xylariales sp. AK1849]
MGVSLWDDQYYGRVAHKLCWGLFAITTAVVALRFYSRLTSKRGRPTHFGALGLDDGLTAFSWIVLLVTQIFITIAAGYGLGRHYDELSPSDQINALKWSTIIDAVIIWAFSLPKLAIIALLRRILNYGLHTAVFFWGLAFVGQALIFSMSVFIFVQCNPTAKNWDKDIPGICLPTDVLIGIEYFVSSWSAFLDLFFAVYPVPFVMRLNMPMKTRIAVSSALSLGVFACIIQGYKLSILGPSFVETDKDPTFPLPYLNTLGMSEACMLLIAGSLPALGPLIRQAKYTLSRITGSRISSVNELSGKTLPSSETRSKSQKEGPAEFIGLDMSEAQLRKESNSTGRTLSNDTVHSETSNDVESETYGLNDGGLSGLSPGPGRQGYGERPVMSPAPGFADPRLERKTSAPV